MIAPSNAADRLNIRQRISDIRSSWSSTTRREREAMLVRVCSPGWLGTAAASTGQERELRGDIHGAGWLVIDRPRHLFVFVEEPCHDNDLAETSLVGHGQLDLARRVRLCLAAQRPELGKLLVEVEGGSVRLAGPVRSFYVRQLALAVVSCIAGVRHIVGEIEVPVPGRG